MNVRSQYALVGTPGCLAVLAQQLILTAYILQGESTTHIAMRAKVGDVGKLCHLAQRHLFASPGNEQRHMRLLQRPRRRGRSRYMKMFPPVGERLSTPQPSHDVDSLVQCLLAFAH